MKLIFERLGILLSISVIFFGIYVYQESKTTHQRPKHRSVGLTMDEFRVTQVHNADFEDHLRWLAMNIYFEARSEPTKGQEAVAWVTLNRVAAKWWPNSIKDVVTDPWQFSWYKAGRTYEMHEKEAWRKAQLIARQVVNQYVNGVDPTNNADHYHASYMTPNWAKSSKQVNWIGNHKFYDLY